jgi:hypothetical protein
MDYCYLVVGAKRGFWTKVESENKAVRKADIFGPQTEDVTETKEICMMRSFIICIPHQTLLEWLK